MIATALILLLVLIGLSIPVGAALGVLGLTLDPLFSMLPLSRAIGELSWSSNNEFLLVAIPLFIMLGEVLLRANIGASTLFSATSGSSVATAATVGTVAIPQIRKYGYNEPLFLGSLAAGGARHPDPAVHQPGHLRRADQFVRAQAVPGRHHPGLRHGGAVHADGRDRLRGQAVLGARRSTRPGASAWPAWFIWRRRWASSCWWWVRSTPAWPPTEAAALGVLGALVLAAWYRRLTWNMLREAVEGTMRSTAMIMLIVIAASFLNFVMSATGLTDALTQSITGLGLSPGWMLLIVIVFYLVLGCFMETLSMMITTIPIVAPIMIGLGYDPIWLGIVIIILVEAALITPPVGLNLFVVQSLRKSGSMGAVIVGSLPFVLAMAVMLALLAWWPDVALWLPRAFG